MESKGCGCQTPGYFISNDDPPTLQRCDDCAVFKDDVEAYAQWEKDGFPAGGASQEVVLDVQKRHQAFLYTQAKLDAMTSDQLKHVVLDMVRVLYPDFLSEGPDWNGGDVCEWLSQIISREGLLRE